LIDTEDLQKVLDFPYSLSVQWNYRGKRYYAGFTEYIKLPDGGHKNRLVYLHDLILGKKNGYTIDHKNRDSLDCRKNNLRYSSKGDNDKNREGCNSNNKLKLRNICWLEQEQCYCVQLQVNKKNTRWKFGKDELDEAILFAEEGRKKYYKKYAGGK
jgi:hypothetical protein